MRIANNDDKTRSAFVYNQEDTGRWFALASKPLDAGQTWDYDPPANGSGFYTVLFHHDKGGGLIMAIGSGNKSATLSFNGLTLCGPC